MPSSPLPSPDAATLTPRAAAALLARCASRAATAALHARLVRCSRAFFRSPYLANCLAAAYSRLGAAPSAVALLRATPRPNVFTRNILLSALLGSGLLEDARRLFDGMPQRDAVTYNAMLSGYVGAALPDEALRLFYSMREHGVRPTGFTFSIVSTAFASARRGQQLHAAAIRHGLAHLDAIVSNALIDMYRRIGLFQDAARVFSCMEEPDVTSWNSVMSAYKDQALSCTVFDCFRSMRSKCFSVDGFSVSTVFSTCSDVKDFAKGDQMLALCVKMSFLANSIVCSAAIDFLCLSDRMSDAVQLCRGMPTWASEPCNAMISGYARSGLMEEALSLFLVSMRNGVGPTEFTFASVLRWSSCFGLMEQGTQIHCLICKLGFQNDVIVSTALTDMYCKLGLTRHARKIFRTVAANDLVLWNTMLLGLLQNGRGKEALVVFRRILKCGIRPDRITLFGAVSACSLQGLVTEGMDIITLFKDRYNIMPSLEHYTCVVDMLCRAGMLREAVNFVENKMPKFSAATFANILEACIIQGNVGMAELVAEKMVMQKSRSSLPYIVLAQIYGARCKWEKMAGVWRSMENERAKKAQSCSWLCIKNRIYVFTSEQILHHGKEATYEVLDLIFWDMMDQPKKGEGLGCLQLFSDCP
ncbi:pentatricopeptide repeat-containing protein [Panicum miliaceum]|uniref:Pentatricopeptide repeat-containing protein n=1 Tax=Panicum miliaceum TaxID=4540 RepID=A0A3L6RZ39_PANMI|nr:pentatricopeptide repeat-containing protein [Panicum miliaceum]